MTDEQMPPLRPDEVDSRPLNASEADIDNALASISGLESRSFLSEPDINPAEPTEQEPLSQPETGLDAATTAETTHDHEQENRFVVPSFGGLERGQGASVVPALSLMAIGAFLTFMLTTSDSPIDTRSLGALLGAIVGASLISHWVSSSRWAMGNLLLGLWALLGAGGAYFLHGFSLIAISISALGIAIVLTAWLTPLGNRRMGILGVSIALIGVVTAFLLTGGL